MSPAEPHTGEDLDHEALAECVEWYVAGKLSAEEEARFEEHYLGCADCRRAVEDAERLHRGLATLAGEQVLRQEIARRTLLATMVHGLGRRGGVFLATALLVAILPGVLLWQQAGRLDSQLDATRRELTTVRRDLEEERQPRINTPILALAPTRAGEQPLQRISLAAEPEWIVLAVELGDDAEEAYRASLTAADGTVVWESTGLVPSYRGTLTVSLHSSVLAPDDYRLSVVGERSWRFPLQIVVEDR